VEVVPAGLGVGPGLLAAAPPPPPQPAASAINATSMKVKVNLATWLKEFLEIWVFIYISPGGDQAAKASFSQSAVKCYLVSGSGYVTDLTAAAEQLSWGSPSRTTAGRCEWQRTE